MVILGYIYTLNFIDMTETGWLLLKLISPSPCTGSYVLAPVKPRWTHVTGFNQWVWVHTSMLIPGLARGTTEQQADFGARHWWCVCSVVQSCPTLWPHGLQPARLLCPCYFPGKNTGVSCHFLLQGIVSTQGSNLRLLPLPALEGRFFTIEPLGKPHIMMEESKFCKNSGMDLWEELPVN